MLLPSLNLIAQAAAAAPTEQQALLSKVGWVLLAVILIAFVAFGMRDLARLSWARVNAISWVCWNESLRRRVLWITPLAIIGAIVVCQLQNAVDPQDAIRQTTKICIFTAGLVVTLVAIILAATNLQKEIETRVIYTIVTKPTTRLDIVLGKLWGFAKVSAAILLIMGVFTLAYLNVRAWRLETAIAGALQGRPETDPSYAALDYYRKAGLLNAKAMIQPTWMQMLARPGRDGEPRVIPGGQGGKFSVRFNLTEANAEQVVEAAKRGAHVSFMIDMPATVRQPTDAEWENIRMNQIPFVEHAAAADETSGATPSATTAATTTSTATTAPTTGPTSQPKVSEMTAEDKRTSRPIPVVGLTFRSPTGDPLLKADEIAKWTSVPLVNGHAGPAMGPDMLERLLDEHNVVVVVEGRSPAVDYAVGKQPVWIQIIEPDGKPGPRFDPLPDPTPGLEGPLVTGSVGRYGQQLVGGEQGGFAVYRFDASELPASGNVNFEVKVGIERSGDAEKTDETLPETVLRVHDPATGTISDAATFLPETNRITYVNLPRSAFPSSGGKFDVLLHVNTEGQWLGVTPDSVALSTGERSFAFNLFKSLLVLWLMSILVVSIALFCSTFVSWPIAVVLTLVILFGRWGVEQIGDVGGGNIGAQMTGQTQDAIAARFERESINALTKALTIISAFLPEISRFEATADIERGISVPAARFGNAGLVLLGYGVPMVCLAYLILKRKEVAP
jgi:ABC-type transport system involved in multi-copper enzyme maturation permease subunit